MDGATWVEILGLASLFSIPLSGLAAYFAWQNYRARPKLELYIGDEANKIHYEEDLAYVHATLANVGRKAATDVQGRVEFQPEGGWLPTKRYTRQVRKYALARSSIDEHIKATSDNWATIHLGTIVPRPYSTEGSLHARTFPDSPRHFILPVEVAAEGQTRLSYWFVCNEGATAEDTVTLDFPEQTGSRSG